MTTSLGWATFKQRARPLVQHVRIDPVGPQQRHLALPQPLLGLEPFQFGGQFDHLLVDLMLGMQAPLPAKGMEPEIADQRRGHGIEAERGQNATKSLAGHHVVRLPTTS